MRFRLTLQVRQQPCVLSMNYQSALQAWIYRCISESNADFATFLHDKGYQYGKRSYKPFTFSPLQIRYYDTHQDLLKIKSETVHLNISMYVDEVAENFVKGVFLDQIFELTTDGWNVACFEVTSVQIEDRPRFQPTMRFRTKSPICLSRPEYRGDKFLPQYMHPYAEDYPAYFLANLAQTYRSTHPQLSEAEQETFLSKPVSFRVLSNPQRPHSKKPRSKLITLKPHTKNPIKVRGYFYEFELTAPTDLIQCGYYAGFGEKTASGFGYCQPIFR